MKVEVGLAIYPVRPEPEPSESLAGYLSRYHFANGLAPPTWTRRATAALRRGTVSRVHQCWWQGAQWEKSIDALVDRSAKVRTALARSIGADWLRTTVAASFCPMCIRERDVHLAVFELPLCTACPAHGLSIVARCSGCRKPLAWGRVGQGWRCSCGQVIARMPAPFASGWQVRLARALEDALGKSALDEGNSLRALYASIDWANELKRRLVLAHGDTAGLLPEQRLPTRERLAPSRWEAVLLEQGASRLAKRGVRLLKRFCRRAEPLLVDLSSLGRWDETLRTLSRLEHLDHPMLEAAVEACHRVRSAHVVSEAYPSILYHPSLTADQRAELDRKLCHWWSQNWTADRQSVEGRRLALMPTDANQADLRNILGFMNGCLRAAMSDRWSANRSALVSMWRPPSQLLVRHASVRSIMDGIGQLQLAELLFVEALLQQDLVEEMPA